MARHQAALSPLISRSVLDTKLVGKARLVVIASHNHAMIKDQCNIILTLEHGKIVHTERTDSLS